MRCLGPHTEGGTTGDPVLTKAQILDLLQGGMLGEKQFQKNFMACSSEKCFVLLVGLESLCSVTVT